MRIALGEQLGLEPDRVEQRRCARAALPWPAPWTSGPKAIVVLDRQPRVQRGVAESWNTICICAVQVAARSSRRERRPPCRRTAIVALIGRMSCIDQARRRRLAAAGLADDAERLALGDTEGDAVDRPHHALAAVQQPAAQRRNAWAARTDSSGCAGPRGGQPPAASIDVCRSRSCLHVHRLRAARR